MIRFFKLPAITHQACSVARYIATSKVASEAPSEAPKAPGEVAPINAEIWVSAYPDPGNFTPPRSTTTIDIEANQREDAKWKRADMWSNQAHDTKKWSSYERFHEFTPR
jgi:hypothetical protein